MLVSKISVETARIAAGCFVFSALFCTNIWLYQKLFVILQRICNRLLTLNAKNTYNVANSQHYD